MIIGFFSDHASDCCPVQGNLTDDGDRSCTRAGLIDDVADIGNENDQAS